MSRCRYGRDRNERLFRSIQDYCAAKAAKQVKDEDDKEDGDTASVDSQADSSVEEDVLAHIEHATKRIQAKHGNLTKREVHTLMHKALKKKLSP